MGYCRNFMDTRVMKGYDINITKRCEKPCETWRKAGKVLAKSFTGGEGKKRLGACHSRWQLEQHRGQLPDGEPQQVDARQPQRQRRFPAFFFLAHRNKA